jgi:hypothetical protein
VSEPAQDAPVRITVATDLDAETAARYYELYLDTFGHLQTKAVARHLLHEHEFLEEMHDPRISKYLAWDGDEVIGVTTLTNQLDAVPWIEPRYFAHHYPEQTARSAVYYLGLTLVKKSRREAHVFQSMIAAATQLILDERAVCAWDMCHYNDAELGLGPAIQRMLSGHTELQVAPIDRQTYFAAVYTPVT